MTKNNQNYMSVLATDTRYFFFFSKIDEHASERGARERGRIEHNILCFPAIFPHTITLRSRSINPTQK